MKPDLLEALFSLDARRFDVGKKDDVRVVRQDNHVVRLMSGCGNWAATAAQEPPNRGGAPRDERFAPGCGRRGPRAVALLGGLSRADGRGLLRH